MPSPQADDDGAAGRIVKRRSPRACVSCHRRKVRCDVVNGGVPCTNCRLDDVDCVLKQSNRGRKSSSSSAASVARRTAAAAAAAAQQMKARAGKEQQPVQRSPVDPQLQSHYPMQDIQEEQQQEDDDDDDEEMQQQPAQESPEHQHQHQHQHQDHSPGSDTSTQSEHVERNKSKRTGAVDQTQDGAAPRDFLFALAFENASQQDSPSHSSANSGQRHRRESRSITTSISPPNAASSSHHAHARDHPSEPHSHSHVHSHAHSHNKTSSHHGSALHAGASHPLLPSYIRPLSSRLKPRDTDYLADVGCFKIPDDELRDELLRVYIRFVYPFMPAIDVEDFIAPILNPNPNPDDADEDHDGDGGDGGVSLLLFQAVMFSSITFVDSSFLHARGYKSRREARKEYFDRAHTLYSFNCEADRTALIQSLVLMAYWYGTPDEDRDTWYWMGIALTAIQVAGCHRNPASPHMPQKEKKLRRRIWWSCVIRDRLIGLGIRRPSRIRNEDISVPMLAIEDFDLAPPSDVMRPLLGDASGFNYLDLETMTSVASTCVELADLSVIAGHILHTQYTVAGTTDGGSSEFLTRAVVRPRRSKEQADHLGRCDAELSAWFERNSAVLDNPKDSSAGILRLCQSLLQTIYLTTVSVLHRPQAFYTANQKTTGQEEAADTDADANEKSNKKVQDAAISLTKLAFDMQSRNLLRYASTSTIPALLSATLIHLLNTRSSDEEVRNISVGRFYHCFGALQQLQDMYASAEYTVRFIKTVLRTAHLNTPLLTMTMGLSSSSNNTSKDWEEGGSSSRDGGWVADQDDASERDDAATAYPSPSMSGSNNHHHNQQQGGFMQQQAARHVHDPNEMQTTSGVFQSLGAAGEGAAWGMPMAAQFHPHASQLDMSFGSPYLSMLGDMEGLDPSLTLMTFDTDPAFLLSSRGMGRLTM